MPIRTKGDKAPLFFVHGEPLRMAQRMEPDRPLYGLSHVYHSDFLDESPESIEGLASSYLSEIRQVQPNGPYHFCGFSAGGMIAFEMARQLNEVGEKVEQLTLIEPTVLSYDSLAQRIKVNMDRTEHKLAYVFWLITRLPKSLRARTRNRLSMLMAKIYFMLKKPLPDNLRWLGYLKSLGPAMRKYDYRPIPSHAVILYRHMSDAERQVTAEFWSRLFTDGAQVISFANVYTHQEFMLDPALEQTVALIERRAPTQQESA
jgi:thioesterase domain-containing protein